MSEENTAVLIAGGGIVGLSAAVFLRRQGVPVLLVERHPGTSMLAKARVLSPRTMELYRGHGLEEAVRAAPPSVFLDATDVVRATTLAGPEEHRGSRPPGESVAWAGPCPPALVEQSTVEPLVRARAEELGADVRFHTELGEVTQDADGVTAQVTDRATGRRYTVRARYVIAADGHRSPLRGALGIRTRGKRLAHVVNMAFEADLTAALRGRPVGLGYLARPVPGTLLARLDGAGRWVLMVPYDPERGEGPQDFTPERCVADVRAAVGDEHLEVRVLPAVPGTSRAVHTWELASWVAEEYRRGRILLAGDAVHVMPPSGGLGANTGIQDVHNLAWKLAAVLQGRAGAELLDTYEPERRPVAELTCALSTRLQEERAGAGGGDAAAQVGRVALGLGYRYVSDAVMEADGDERLGEAGRPGTRAPHLAVERAGRAYSSIDAYGPGFTLVLGPDAAPDRPAAGDGRLEVLRIGRRLSDSCGQWAAAHGVGSGGAVLVRPDGFIAWRAHAWDTGTARELPGVLDRVLALPRPSVTGDR
ncbi:putative polyketide hydroxylase [Streptomyces sp. V4I23]|uniref:FAD-dependent oxidoreductase n=1 Tax=Streptomyces sp. V4I23 TaxID=3042282 RepID=UPI0027893D04|nr:FAD-dependent oxidoreductase [Streptomyces sp. V4I23]MDQ1008553.1 putative polyketide hydroxylase [Streptomyces sp. V4I23]